MGQSLEIGNDEIDSQHKEIFKRVNKLLSAMADGSGKDTIGKLIEFLTDYVVSHFDAEESLMRKHHYTEYQLHKMQHKLLTTDVLQIKQEFEGQGASSNLVIQIQKKVCNWLKSHISTEDKKFVLTTKTRNICEGKIRIKYLNA